MSVRTKFWLIMVLSAVAAILAYPREDTILGKIGLRRPLQVQQGLDLQGGAQLTYQADLKGKGGDERRRAMDGLVNVIQNRVNPGGTSEVVVQTVGSDRISVELPGIKDVGAAAGLIGETAQLTFVELSADATSLEQAQPTGITGEDVNRAEVSFDANTNEPVVSLRLKSGSIQKFSQLTSRINQSGTRMATLLDDQVIFGPATVSTPITDGNAQLQGSFTIEEAKRVAQLINGGALPVPISLVEQRTVGPTLGQESVAKSLLAGIIGLGVVALFMLSYYRLPGLVAVLALLIYSLLTLALYKLSSVTPYTIVLTLAGIAGFILSIGMAVDANILIFERWREEVRRGKSLLAGLEAGFDRAWSSIRDSNVTTLISCFILYNFSGSTPIIKGFAVTLGLGVLISMFTAIVVSRTFLRLFIRSRLAENLKLQGVD